MKLNFFTHSTLALAVMLSSGSAVSAHDMMPPPPTDSLITKPPVAAKGTIIKLFPNPTFTGSIIISSNVKEELHFYVFDLESTLMCQIVLKGKEKKMLPHLKKGIYTYNVFRKDESIEQGKIVAK